MINLEILDTSVGNGFEYRIEYSNILIFDSFK